VTIFDAVGLAGVALILAAYGSTQFRWLDPHKATAALMNLFGAGLILVSLSHAFNLSAFLMEAAWAAIAAISLIRALTIKRRS